MRWDEGEEDMNSPAQLGDSRVCGTYSELENS